MIISLSIENFALIEKLNINFSEGFSVITGETGAGKSILLGALGLLLGKRADLTSLKNKEEKCIIEATFNIKKYNLHSFFDENDIDFEEETIIRREILPSGKSRAFINDSPTNLQQLQDLGFYLIDIHSQHQTLELSNQNFQIELLDLVAKNQDIIKDYSATLSQFKKVELKFNELLASKNALSKEQDYTTFLLEELIAADLKVGEQEMLETELEKLNNVEFIKENIEKTIAIADDEQFGVIQNLKEIKLSLQKISNLSDNYKEINDRINSVIIEFEDINQELKKEAENLELNPEKIELYNQKLQLLYALQKKHQVETVEELLEIKEDLDAKVFLSNDIDNQLNKLENEIREKRNYLNELALQISKSRVEVAPRLVGRLTDILAQLGMPNAQFKFDIKYQENYFSTGKDEIQLLFSANKGSDFGLLKKVASGGEMSRIMLAVKSVLSSDTKLPTIIFDEIDTGISGEIANKMAEIMKVMSKEMQILAITHLPQIAAKGKFHYKVFKTIKENTTISEIKLLNSNDRVLEIAEMLSGKDMSESAVNHAKALLN
ncbi:DNA repair protein RecN [Flavobacterium dankookense]|uniref:DNA repair protein RecN n=1 Tax=Flavobacterium dankookense TaxID=706186 RepID=A0A4R6Q632_9FLAO|nr:DNA repair protein RecN [Flavobacterium dankookense]TDP57537.1 DNA replication and repair protein RecN [Flavobacterium dankookense]